MVTILELLSGIKPDWATTLPIPPSSNQMYMPIATKGRSRVITTKVYKTWKNCIQFYDWRESVFLHRVFVTLEIRPGPGLKEKTDSNNYAKPTIDALVNNGILIDDSKKYLAGELSYFGETHPHGDGVVVIRVYPESVLNGVEKSKDLFDGEAVQ
jgi:hypothetical protein